MPFIPDINQKEILLAQNYLLKQKVGKEIEEDVEGKSAFDNVYKTVSVHCTPNNIINSFISEKGFDYEGVKNYFFIYLYFR